MSKFAIGRALIIHRRFAPPNMPAAECGPAAFIDASVMTWNDILSKCRLAEWGISDAEAGADCVPGSWVGCRTAVVTPVLPAVQGLAIAYERWPDAAKPMWYAATPGSALRRIVEAGKWADVIFVHVPSRLFPGATALKAAAQILDVVYGGGGIFHDGSLPVGIHRE